MTTRSSLPGVSTPAGRSTDQAYNAKSIEVSKKQLEHLAKSYEKAHPGAAASIREGLDETLTVIGLGLGASLRRSLSTTNAIESTFATVRRVSRRVTRWPSGTMALRWALAGIREAENKYRRLMGSKTDMPKLITALRRLDVERTSESNQTG